MTGSNSIDPNKKSKFIKHSGSGRIAKMQMLTMSLYESLESNGKISLKELFDNKDLDIDGITSEMSIENSSLQPAVVVGLRHCMPSSTKPNCK